MSMMRAVVLALAASLAWTSVASAQTAVWPPIADPPTAIHTPGRFVWVDLVTNDVGAAAEFYGKVFGWTFETVGPADDDLGSYTTVLTNGQAIAGMVFGGDALKATTGGRWVGLISAADAGATAALVRGAGGSVLAGPHTLGDRGEVALFRDPTGAVFGVIDSASGDPEDYLGDVGEWLWAELWTENPRRAVDFYRAVFGYDARPGEGAGSFSLLKDGVARAGILQKPEGLPAGDAWIPYVRVADVDETARIAREGGGRVLIPPTRYVGTRAALLVDPVGAPFAVAEWNR